MYALNKMHPKMMLKFNMMALLTHPMITHPIAAHPIASHSNITHPLISHPKFNFVHHEHGSHCESAFDYLVKARV